MLMYPIINFPFPGLQEGSRSPFARLWEILR
jgi:hypothetical protein